MVTSDDPQECLLRAAHERSLADGATLESVRELHLRSARAWEELSSRIQRLAEGRALRRTSESAPPDTTSRGTLPSGPGS